MRVGPRSGVGEVRVTHGEFLDIRCAQTPALEAPLNLGPCFVERDPVGRMSQASRGSPADA